MDPKRIAGLDPKLKEVYDRVMSTPVHPITPPAPPSQPAPTATTNPIDPIALPSAPLPHSQQPIKPQSSIPQNTVAAVVTSSTRHVNVNKKGLSPIVIGAGLVLFIAAYSFLWIKIFNLKLPF